MPERGRVRLAIVRVRARAHEGRGRARRRVASGGIAGAFANEIDRTSAHARHPDRRRGPRLLGGHLVPAVAGRRCRAPDGRERAAETTGSWTSSSRRSRGSARIDPGPAADPRVGQPVADDRVPDGDDFLDDLGDAFKLGVLIVAGAIALPFILGAVLLAARARRRRPSREREVREAGERSADDELVELGEDIRSLDLDTSMPNASRGGARPSTSRRSRATTRRTSSSSGDPTEYRVEQARAAIAAGRRHIAAARERLG